ncbi:MAG: ModD protein [Brooklawnia sp.]|jgi:molybdenum transport protein
MSVFHFTRAEFEQFLTEDVPYYDLTTAAIGASGSARIGFRSREDGVVCGTEEVRGLFEILGMETESALKSGEQIEPGQELLVGAGATDAVFAVWKVGQNILDRASGIATAAARWTTKIRAAGLTCPVLTTRKSFPGTRKLATKACVVGGAVPHRLGTSETLLFFAQHIALAGGMTAFIDRIPQIKTTHCEKKLIVECQEIDRAPLLLAAGADGIQFDKLPASLLTQLVRELRPQYPERILLAAGGVTEDNLLAYAESGVDGIVTTALYNARPLDIGVTIAHLP